MKIVITTGGTGGHIFPALQMASVLKERGHEVVFIGSFALAEEKVRAQGFEATVIRAQGLTQRSLGGILKFTASMTKAIGQSLKALKKARPDKVVGFGGYGSLAVVLAARLLNIPTMIHEQNVVPGKANRLMMKMVQKVAISFQETRNHVNSDKVVWTGCPCHQGRPMESRENLLKKFSLDPQRKTILVLGGSQGSQKLNEVFFEMISSWEQSFPAIQAIHMTGKKEYSLYAYRYQDAAVPVKVMDFISPIEEAYVVADLVIARSGAATVSELGFFAIPTIFIPYPLADGHQKYNAEVLSKLGLASIIEQKDLTADGLKLALNIVLSSDFNKEAWQRKNADFFKLSPALELACAVENL
ncbi:MAG: undecaprenyldiphospho-muramoylpentapeptide beta-N-acetylglucosaminyltransferase [Candidatus Omnitrophica bacterium]|nr:undecaprenyldiphospho-muramoylpentapeptide beta-N-acetylglucosaminyltransferase [Candidatus Omnitrophota bacterium]